jgi:hypothetical protein
MDEAEDRAAWERDCLEALIHALEDPEVQEDMLTYMGRRVDGVRLERSYPETAIVVSSTYVRTGTSEEWPIQLWDPESEWQHEGGERSDPSDVAYIIERDLTWP